MAQRQRRKATHPDIPEAVRFRIIVETFEAIKLACNLHDFMVQADEQEKFAAEMNLPRMAVQAFTEEGCTGVYAEADAREWIHWLESSGLAGATNG